MGPQPIYSIRFKDKGEKITSRWSIIEAANMIEAIEKFAWVHPTIEVMECIELTLFTEIIT